jgi:hypothetical protein
MSRHGTRKQNRTVIHHLINQRHPVQCESSLQLHENKRIGWCVLFSADPHTYTHTLTCNRMFGWRVTGTHILQLEIRSKQIVKWYTRRRQKCHEVLVFFDFTFTRHTHTMHPPPAPNLNCWTSYPLPVLLFFLYHEIEHHFHHHLLCHTIFPPIMTIKWIFVLFTMAIHFTRAAHISDDDLFVMVFAGQRMTCGTENDPFSRMLQLRCRHSEIMIPIRDT